jgi:membrane protease YdiL (CAAX protease family)
MKELFMVLDIVSAIGIVITLNLVQKYNKAWFWYAIAAFLFTLVMGYSRLPGVTIMGLILTCTGIKNYLKGKK